MILKTPAMFVAALAMAVSGTALAQSQTETDEGTQAGAATEKTQKSEAGKSKTQQPQEAHGKTQSTETATGTSSGTILDKQQSSQTLGSSLVGMTVKNGAGQDAVTIGTINDLVLNENHEVVGVLVGVGGFLGIAETNYGVAWDALQVNKDKSIAIVDITRKQLDQASAYMTLAEQKAKREQQRAKQNMQQQQQTPASGGITQ